MDVCIGDCLNYFFVDQNIEKIGGKERKENWISYTFFSWLILFVKRVLKNLWVDIKMNSMNSIVMVIKKLISKIKREKDTFKRD